VSYFVGFVFCVRSPVQIIQSAIRWRSVGIVAGFRAFWGRANEGQQDESLDEAANPPFVLPKSNLEIAVTLGSGGEPHPRPTLGTPNGTITTDAVARKAGNVAIFNWNYQNQGPLLS